MIDDVLARCLFSNDKYVLVHEGPFRILLAAFSINGPFSFVLFEKCSFVNEMNSYTLWTHLQKGSGKGHPQ